MSGILATGLRAGRRKERAASRSAMPDGGVLLRRSRRHSRLRARPHFLTLASAVGLTKVEVRSYSVLRVG